MKDGENVSPTSKKDRQEWLDKAMRRMEEIIPYDKLKEIRETNACCLSGERDKLAKEIHKKYNTIEERFNAFINEKRIVYGNCYKEGDYYYLSFWYGMPEGGYTCSCLHYIPKTEPMTKTWCMCCGGHIKHHFETALGVKAECEVVSSPLSSCGKQPCLFKLKIKEIID